MSFFNSRSDKNLQVARQRSRTVIIFDQTCTGQALSGFYHDFNVKDQFPSLLRFVLIDTHVPVMSSLVSGTTAWTTLTHSRCVVSSACLLITRIGVLGFSQYEVSGIFGYVSYVFHVSYDSNTYSSI